MALGGFLCLFVALVLIGYGFVVRGSGYEFAELVFRVAAIVGAFFGLLGGFLILISTGSRGHRMSFTPHYSGSWAESSIRSIPDGKVGVYAVHNATVTIYVGMGDLKSRLQGHLSGDDECLASHRPTGWIAEVTDTPDKRRRTLVAQFTLPCNQQGG